MLPEARGACCSHRRNRPADGRYADASSAAASTSRRRKSKADGSRSRGRAIAPCKRSRPSSSAGPVVAHACRRSAACSARRVVQPSSRCSSRNALTRPARKAGYHPRLPGNRVPLCAVIRESHSHSSTVEQRSDVPRRVIEGAALSHASDAPTASDDDAQTQVRSVAAAERVRPYVPRTVQQHLVDDPDSRCWIAEGTAVIVDISGFTQLSEQLARKGREGAEQITDAISDSFESILFVAYKHGGGLLKFGGDALLLWFHGDDHVDRACRATVLMRAMLEDVGRIELPDARVTLQMSQGVHSGKFHFFAVGTSHTEFLPAGPAWSRLVSMERAADAGDIVISEETAATLPNECVGDAKGPGRLVRNKPPG